MSDEQVTKDDLFVELLSRTTLLENKVEALWKRVGFLETALERTLVLLDKFTDPANQSSMKFKGIENE